MADRWKIGDSVDVVSGEFVYCPAIVLLTKTERAKPSVRVHYIGWPSSYDENITDMDRILEGYSVVKKVKIWAKLTDKMPHWPCIGFIRQPVPDQKIGVDELKIEKKLYIVPCGKTNKYTAPFFHGVWLDTSKLEAYTKNFDYRRARGLEHQQRFFKEEFAAALEDCELNKEASTPSLRFNGSLEENSYRLFRAERLGLGLGEDQGKEDPPPVPLTGAEAVKMNKKSTKSTKAAAAGGTVFAPALPVTLRLDSRRVVDLTLASDSGCQAITSFYHHLHQAVDQRRTGASSSGALSTLDAAEALTRLQGPVITSFLRLDAPGPVSEPTATGMSPPEAPSHGRVLRKSMRPRRADVSALPATYHDRLPVLCIVPPAPALQSVTPSSKERGTKRRRQP